MEGRLWTETVVFPDRGRNIVRDMSVEHVMDVLINELKK